MNRNEGSTVGVLPKSLVGELASSMGISLNELELTKMTQPITSEIFVAQSIRLVLHGPNLLSTRTALALMMSTHERLGENSSILVLPKDIMERILFPERTSMSS